MAVVYQVIVDSYLHNKPSVFAQWHAKTKYNGHLMICLYLEWVT